VYQMKTSELIGAALDWAVAKCEGVTVLPKMRGGCYVTLNKGETVLLCYSTDWAQGGPIIEREGISIRYSEKDARGAWYAVLGPNRFLSPDHEGSGPTPLIAAMRCYVASKLGDDINMPEELTA
jgi:hypothetical protein